MITLTFRAQGSDSIVFVRGTYFRICADGTLRGPDNAITASYIGGIWQLGRKPHRMLECREAVYLRVTTEDGQRKCIGPYECLKVSGGSIFSHDLFLGVHTRADTRLQQGEIWREIALLSEI